jgi:sugar lactone lactonase YvrE
MRGHRRTGVARASLGLLAALLALPPAAIAQVADRKNHYILECGDECLSPGLKAIGAPHGITTDADGSVYFATQNVVFRLGRDGALARVAGTGEPGYTGDGGPAVEARLNIPDVFPELDMMDTFPLVGGLAVDASGKLFIADAYNDRIRVVDTDGTISTMIDLVGRVKVAHWPQGLAFDRRGDLYISTAAGRLSRRGPDGTLVDVLFPYCSDAADVACGSEQLAIDGEGAVFYSDMLCRVRKWTAREGTVTVAGQEPTERDFGAPCGYWGDGGPATRAGLSYQAYGVAIDRAGRLVIADTFNHCIRRVDGAGVITTVAGQCGRLPALALFVDWPPGRTGVPAQSASIGDAGPATSALLNTPMGVAVGPDDTIYIADTGHLRVRQVTPDGIITTVAGNGRPLQVNAVGSATPLP